jgi:hypothetical protein
MFKRYLCVPCYVCIMYNLSDRFHQEKWLGSRTFCPFFKNLSAICLTVYWCFPCRSASYIAFQHTGHIWISSEYVRIICGKGKEWISVNSSKGETGGGTRATVPHPNKFTYPHNNYCIISSKYGSLYCLPVTCLPDCLPCLPSYSYPKVWGRFCNILFYRYFL